MTYDEAVNTILEHYMLGDFPGWVMTDDCTVQMRRVTKDGDFEFIELSEVLNSDNNTIVLYHEFIDLSDYSDGELWFYGSMYYETEEEFEEQGAGIMAECVYEQTRTVDALGSPDKMLKQYLKFAKEDNA